MFRKISTVFAGALAVAGWTFAQDDASNALSRQDAGKDKTPDAKVELKAGKDKTPEAKFEQKTPKKLPEITEMIEPAPIMPATTTQAPTEVFSQPLPRPDRFSVIAEFLHWGLHRADLPPLATTAAPEADSKNTGTLGQAGTMILFGENGLNFTDASGLRVRTRFALAADSSLALELGGFALDPRNTNFSVNNTSGLPFYTRPFFDTFNNRNSGYDIQTKDGVEGSFNILAHTRLWGFEANLAITPWERSTQLRYVNFLLGYRSLTLLENVALREEFIPRQPGILSFNGLPIDNIADVRLVVNDYFATSNRFHGVQIGANAHWQSDRFSFDILAKVAAGVMRQQVTIAGLSTATPAANFGPPIQAGILALPSNSGRFNRNEFALVPEVGFRVNYDVSSWFRIHFGYDVLYASSVVRAGSQISGKIDIREVPTDQSFNPDPMARTRSPQFRFQDDAYWAHGINFGVECRY